MGSHFGSSSHAISGIDLGWLGNQGDVSTGGAAGQKAWLARSRASFRGALALLCAKAQQLDSLDAQQRRRGRGLSGYVPFSSGCLAGDQCAKDR